MKDHNEWFETSEDRAVSVVKKWTSWMAAKPYFDTRLKNKLVKIPAGGGRRDPQQG